MRARRECGDLNPTAVYLLPDPWVRDAGSRRPSACPSSPQTSRPGKFRFKAFLALRLTVRHRRSLQAAGLVARLLSLSLSSAPAE
jgi:hypothetical protein